jgi:hypothetical protein
VAIEADFARACESLSGDTLEGRVADGSLSGSAAQGGVWLNRHVGTEKEVKRCILAEEARLAAAGERQHWINRIDSSVGRLHEKGLSARSRASLSSCP